MAKAKKKTTTSKPKKKTKKPAPKKNDTKSHKGDKALIVIIIIVAAVFGVFYLSIQSNPEPIQPDHEPQIKAYGDYIFLRVGDDAWVSNITVSDWLKGWTREYQFFFHYTPDEVEDVPTLKNSRNESISPNLFLQSKKIYITTDPEYPAEVVLSGVEIAKILGPIYEYDVEAAINRPHEDTPFPVITCQDLEERVRVIELRLGNSTRIYNDKGCLVVEGETATDMLRAATRLVYELLVIL